MKKLFLLSIISLASSACVTVRPVEDMSQSGYLIVKSGGDDKQIVYCPKQPEDGVDRLIRCRVVWENGNNGSASTTPEARQ